MRVSILLALLGVLDIGLAQSFDTCEDIFPVSTYPCATTTPNDGSCCACFGGGSSCEGCQPTPCPTMSPTKSPTTADPTTATPTRRPTPHPTTPSPTTARPTTAEPTTAEPTTAEPTTATPTTAKPTTGIPTRRPTPLPTTPEPTTREPTRRPTPLPTTPAPTPRPTTLDPTARPTPRPTTRDPTVRPTPRPTTRDPTVRPTPRPTTPAPTPRPTTRDPTRRPTPYPTTRDPTRRPTNRPTNRPTTTTTAQPTSCTCPPVEVCTPSPLTVSTKKKKKNKAQGCGVGACDCEKGVTEIRYKYRGTANPVQITIYLEEGPSQPVCRFNNVVPGQQISCSLKKPSSTLLIQGLAEFENETPFVITGPNGYSCSAQYHTSCSSDIVGVVQPECTDLVVSGWQDMIGSDCDDGVPDTEDCNCEPTTNPNTPTPAPTPQKVTKVIGDYCYCEDPNAAVGTPTTGVISTPTKKKGKKSKGGKKGSKKKGKSKESGMGKGDCDCSGGQVELTMVYQGTVKADIVFLADSRQICKVQNVNPGQELTCNARDAGLEKLEKDTFIRITRAGSNSLVCSTSFHTSCSRDIVGTYGDGGCGTQLLCTGWRDGDNFSDGQLCDDGLTLCDCDSGTLVREIADPQDLAISEFLSDTCFCSSVTGLIPDKSSTGLGYGSCECTENEFGDKGIKNIRYVYLPQSTTSLTGPVDIKVCLDASCGEKSLVCESVNVLAGEENECDVNAAYEASDTLNAYRLRPTTTFVMTDSEGNECKGNVRTQCSEDVIGYTPTGCPDLIISGWTGLNEADDCDDGFYPCACKDCTPYSVEGAASSECAQTEGCFYNEATDTCAALSASLYTVASAPKQGSLWIVGIAVVASAVMSRF